VKADLFILFYLSDLVVLGYLRKRKSFEIMSVIVIFCRRPIGVLAEVLEVVAWQGQS